MKVLITGASSGIGRDMARVLATMGFDLFLAARRIEKLKELKRELPVKVRVIGVDLSSTEGCLELYEQVKEDGIDILINNAGLGAYGLFDEITPERDQNLIDVNIRATHILTKLFLSDFKKRNQGRILNVASSAAFLPGPKLAAYYASKAYVLRLTQGIREELRHSHSKVVVSALCPGPVRTEFDKVADTRFSTGYLESEQVARYAVKKLMQGKAVIIPGGLMKMGRFFTKILPDGLLARASYHMQNRRK